MTIGFSFRTAASRSAVTRAALACSAVCAAGLLAAQGPATALGARGPGAARPAALPPSSLHQPGTRVRLRTGAPDVPANISALSWVVADARTGDILAAHNAHRRLPPASTLKTLFALTVLPMLPGSTLHTVKERELEGIGAGSSMVGVVGGITYRVADLWRGVFLNSGNDAVHVLASMNGGWTATAAQMQAKARSLGADDTYVVSPDGYDTPGQVSSAYDLAVFGRAGLRDPDFARYCSTAEAMFPGENGSSYGIQNTNRLLTGASGVGRYPGLIGVKNGYTTNAGNTLVAAAKHGTRTLVVTVMHPQAGGGTTVYEEARSLLDWGFAADGRVDPVGTLPDAPAAPAAGPSTPAGPSAPSSVPSRPVARPPAAAAPPANSARPAAAPPEDAGLDWPGAAEIAGAAVLGAAGVALALRLRARRSGRG
ncbi:D-alanyl-D-alanine carboxypeptidase [Streptomyces populi]|uniref:D-alanyl-D-alanine carboxypeptidase n=1 Tax=Streptomyces populi TaxID=2058924 RepID=A0A2I0SPE9_9ACTN|nr:D-alanyl-D-alanine carboxypeptidase [Streptomyces populi]PKT71775.1 D-alanyl-D-alanine carboxypeptidase [Streptomyces populi]